MKTHYDRDADEFRLRFTEGRIVETEEVAPGVVLAFDGEGRIVALEVQQVSRHLAAGAFADVAAE